MNSRRAIEQAFKELAPRYEEVMDSELRQIWGWTYPEFVNQLLDLTNIEDNDVVLDIATGTAVIPIRLSSERQNGNRYIGLDITPGMLQRARQKIIGGKHENHILLTCASAMKMPFRSGAFNQITCGLATHHMDTAILIPEMLRVLKPGGKVTIADVGASPLWKFMPLRMLLRVIIFFYFLAKEGFARSWAEATSISNMMTAEEWEKALAEAGFLKIEVNKMKSRHFWAPSPIALKACKQNGSGMSKR